MGRNLLPAFLILISACSSSTSGKTESLFDLHIGTADLSKLKNNRASVFVFFSPDCPLSQKYSLTVKNLAARFANEKIVFYPVFPGKLYSAEETNNFLKEYELNFPVLMDSEKKLTTFLSATVTPEAVLVDSVGNVLYKGAIDNWFEDINRKREVVTENYLSDAIGSFLQNKNISVRETKAVGCIIE